MSDEVQQDISDFRGGFRLATFWSDLFLSLECAIMIVSLLINICLVRAVAFNKHKEIPLYFFLFFLFFTSLVDDALIVEHFMAVSGYQTQTTTICRFLTFTSIGNKLLQVFTVISMTYYGWVSLEYKSSRIEQYAKKYFMAIVVALILLEVFFTLPPTMNVRGSAYAQYCFYVRNDLATSRRTGWLYMVFFPYFLPMVITSFPLFRIVMKLREGPSAVQDRLRTQLKIIVTVTLGYFFFNMLYYLLMFGKEVEATTLDKSEFRRMLGLHIWFITRPMFSFIALGWHVITPLAPFVLDDEFYSIFPGMYVNKHRKLKKLTQQESMNSIGLEEKRMGRESPEFEGDLETSVGKSSSSRQVSSEQITTEVFVHRETNWTEVSNPMAQSKNQPSIADMIDQREFNQSIS